MNNASETLPLVSSDVEAPVLRSVLRSVRGQLEAAGLECDVESGERIVIGNGDIALYPPSSSSPWRLHHRMQWMWPVSSPDGVAALCREAEAALQR